MKFEIIQGDCLESLRKMPANSVHCCVTSPPYWGLRDYGQDGQLGLEESPELYVQKMNEIFREVRRVLRDDGTLWLNLGDSYAAQGGGKEPGKYAANTGNNAECGEKPRKPPIGLKAKDLVGIPWMIAFALRADGWYLRQDIIWAKPNPMPESVRDRCTKSHEYIFLLSKSGKYYYDAEAIAEPAGGWNGSKFTDSRDEKTKPNLGKGPRTETSTRNKRSVWWITPKPFRGAHFATFPPDLVEPCILAGTSEKGCCSKCGTPWKRIVERKTDWQERKEAGEAIRHGLAGAAACHSGNYKSESSTVGWQPSCKCNTGVVPCTVLDPFCGSGTTGVVALKHRRNFIGLELNPEYCEMSRKRISDSLPEQEDFLMDL